MQILDKTSVVKPFIKWVGGKQKNLPKLFSYVPEHIETYVEPFLGGGSMYFALDFKKAIVNDSNPELIAAYRQVKNNLPELKEMLRTFKYEKDFFLEIRAWDREENFKDRSELEHAARLIYLIKSCFNGLYRVNSKNYFNTPFGRYTSVNYCDDKVFDTCSAYLNERETTILNQDYSTLLDVIPDNAFVYLDPPYHPLTDTSHFTSYQPGDWSEDQQRKLGDFCTELDKRGIKFMQTNSTAALMFDIYKHFKITTTDSLRLINSNANKRSSIKELIITNY